jgi:hypothetical protein
MAAADEGWTVVRSKRGAKHQAGASAIKRAREEMQGADAMGHGGGGCCPGHGPVTGGAADQHARGPAASEPATASSVHNTGNAARGRRGRAAGVEASQEQRVQRLVAAVEACCREVLDSPFYARLQQARNHVLRL